MPKSLSNARKKWMRRSILVHCGAVRCASSHLGDGRKKVLDCVHVGQVRPHFFDGKAVYAKGWGVKLWKLDMRKLPLPCRCPNHHAALIACARTRAKNEQSASIYRCMMRPFEHAIARLFMDSHGGHTRPRRDKPQTP